MGLDGSYSEVFGYLKSGFIASVLLLIPAKRQRPVYLALTLIFAVVLLDDVLRLHERVGAMMIATLTQYRFAEWLSHSFGEMVLWAALGLPLLAVAWVAYRRSPVEDRANALLLLGGLAVLVLFAVVFDVIHEFLELQLRVVGSGLLFTILEEGGEQITLSLICALALLIHREVRSRAGETAQ